MFMCDEPIEKWNCMLNCNTNECLVLDEENCRCVPDPVCEAEKFCGGNLEDCKCHKEDGGSWCSALTGDSIKTWIFTYAYDSLNDEIITGIDITNYIWACIYEGYFRYQLTHTYLELCGSPPEVSSWGVFLWEFDNVTLPTKILYHRENYWREFERTIIKLTADTLILTWPDKKEFNGWIAYVPQDR
jgi:hypothetical protein